MTNDLLDYRDRYPDAPGFKARQTSQDAADSMRGRAARMRGLCLEITAAAGKDGMTADEVAAALDVTVLSARPRMSELATTGEVADSGRRRKNSSGRSAIVWIATARA